MRLIDNRVAGSGLLAVVLGSIAFLLIITAFFFASGTEIAGLTSLEPHSQSIDLVIGESRTVLLRTIDAGEISLASLSLSGEIKGDGVVKVWLDNTKGEQKLVFRNIMKSGNRITGITGMAYSSSPTSAPSTIRHDDKTLLAVVVEDPIVVPPQAFVLTNRQQTYSGSFLGACLESCALEAPNWSSSQFRLRFEMQPGTHVVIKRINYVVAEPLN